MLPPGEDRSYGIMALFFRWGGVSAMPAMRIAVVEMSIRSSDASLGLFPQDDDTVGIVSPALSGSSCGQVFCTAVVSNY